MIQALRRARAGITFGIAALTLTAFIGGCNTPSQPLGEPGALPIGKVVVHDAAWIGASGGMLQAGPYTLVVPSGAVLQNTYFELEQVNAGSYPVELSPHGLQFHVPVTLMIDAAGTPDPGAMAVHWWNPSSGQWEEQASSHAGTTVSAQLEHFSRYTVW